MKKEQEKKNNWTKVRKEKLRNPSLDQRKCPFLEKKYFSHACSESSNISKVKIILKSNLNFHPSMFREILWTFYRFEIEDLIRIFFGRYRFDFIKNLIPLWGCLLVYSTSMFACLSGYIWYMYLRPTQTDMIHTCMVPNSWVRDQNSYFAKERKKSWIKFQIKKQSSI